MIPEDYRAELSKLSTERMTQFLHLMDRFETLSWRNIRNIITVGVWDAREKDRLFALAIESEKANKSPQEVDNFEFALRIAVSGSFHIAEKIGGISGIGSMVFEPSATFDRWEDFNPNLLTRNFDEGNFGRISGTLGSGKTNNSCVIIEQWVSQGNLAISNIQKKKSSIYEYTNNAREMLEIIASFERGKKWLFVYDEGGASGYGKADWNTLKSKYLDKFFRIIRKLYGNLLYIDQREWTVPTIVSEWSLSKFHCIEKGIFRIELMTPNKFDRTVMGFPKTAIPFNTRDIASFEMNVNIDKLFQAMSGEDEPYDAMLDFLATKESQPPKNRVL